MAIGLDDIKKQKANISEKTSKAKKKRKKTGSKKKSKSVKTKPWEDATKKSSEKTKQTKKKSATHSHRNDSTPKSTEISGSSSINLEEIIKWGKKVKIYPEIEIPIPDFLLSKKNKK